MEFAGGSATVRRNGLLERLSKDFAVYGFGEVAVKAFGLITLPVYTRAFDPGEYGTLSLVLTVAGLLGAVLILGGDSAYARFFFEAKSREQRQLITSTWIGFLAGWSVLVCLALLPFTSSIGRLATGDRTTATLFAVLLLTAPISLVNRMCAQVLRNEFRPLAYTVLNILGMTLQVGLAIAAIVLLHLGIVGVLGAMLIGELVLLPPRLWTARSMFRRAFSATILRRLLAFGLPLVPTSLAYWVFLTSDRVILGQLSTLDELGLYSVANSVVGLASIALSAFGQAWSPHAVSVYEQDADHARAVYGRVMTYVLFGFGILAVGLTTFGHELLAVLTSGAYAGAVAGIAPLAIGMVALATTQVTAGGFSLMKRTHLLTLLAWVAAVVNIGLNLLLDASFGMLGAAWATAASYVLLTVLYMWVSHGLWAVAYERRRSISLAILVVVFVLLATLLPAGWDPLTLGLKLLTCTAFALATVVLGALDERELGVLGAWLRAARQERQV